MNVDRAVFAFGGLVVFVSVVLGYYTSPYWFLLTGFAGLNLFQSAFTGFCPAALVFKAIGLKPGNAFK